MVVPTVSIRGASVRMIVNGCAMHRVYRIFSLARSIRYSLSISTFMTFQYTILVPKHLSRAKNGNVSYSTF